MLINMNLDKRLICRYAEVAGKIMGDKNVTFDKVWGKEINVCKTTPFFNVTIAERFHERIDTRLLSVELAYTDKFFYDVLDVLDKHAGEIKMVVAGITNIAKGMQQLMTGVTKDMNKVMASYGVKEAKKTKKTVA